MAQHIRPFWQIIASAKDSSHPVVLTCEECFAILDHLTSLALVGVAEKDLKIAVRSYLAHCPDCEEYYDDRIQQLEAWLDVHRRTREV